MDPIRPVERFDRTVQPVDLTRLSPLEREEQRERREQARKRREKALKARESEQDRPSGGLDVRA
jgi:hypothetical protein